MKKVMYITDLYPHKHNPAAGIFVKHQLAELSKHCQIYVLATCDKYHLAIEHANEDNITVCRAYYPYWQKFFLSSLFTYPLFAMPAMITAHLRWKPDIIHVHDYRHVPELVWLRLWLRVIHKPQYLTLHNIRTHPDRLGANPLKWFYKQGLKLALHGWTHIFTVNSRLADWVYEQGYTNERVTITGNGIHPFTASDSVNLPINVSNAEEGCFKVISVGNLVPEKGFDLLIKAVGRLIAQSLDIRVLIIGDGSERHALSQLIDKLHLQEHIQLAGVLPNDVVRSYYPHFDAFILPSYSESFGIVYIEAMYAGIPVIGIAGEGVSGLFTNGTEALFAKPKDLDDLTNTILQLISNPQQREQMATAAQTKVKNNFMLYELAEKIVEVYER